MEEASTKDCVWRAMFIGDGCERMRDAFAGTKEFWRGQL
jgi:hypothetical protein